MLVRIIAPQRSTFVRTYSTSHFRKPTVLIAGAGPAGLACALTLKNRGIEAEVIDSALDNNHHRGVGVLIQKNGINVLSKLGIADHVRSLGQDVTAEKLLDRHSQTTSRSSCKPPAIGIEKLQLIKAFTDQGIKVRKGSSIVKISKSTFAGDTAYKVSLKKTMDTETYTILVGADGPDSKIRGDFFDDSVIELKPPMQHGIAHIFMKRPHDIAKEESTDLLGALQRLVGVPCGDDKYFAWTTYFSRMPLTQSKSGDKPKETMMKYFSPLHNEFTDSILDDINQASTMRVWYPTEVTMDSYVNQHVAMIGDAAFAMWPHLLQGASLAMESGFVLGTKIADAYESGEKYSDALSAYDVFMRQRVKFVKTENDKYGKRVLKPPGNRWNRGIQKIWLGMFPPGKKTMGYLTSNELPGATTAK